MKLLEILFAMIAVVALYPLYKLLRHITAIRRLERCFRYRIVPIIGVTWSGAFAISVYLIANGVTLVLQRDRLERWAGVIAAVNLVPLFLGGRRNIVIHYFGLHAHHTLHCTVGCVAIVAGCLHFIFAVKSNPSRTSPWEYLVSICLIG